MNVITSFAAGLVATRRSTDRILETRSQLDDLQRQLATGKRSDTYSGLGVDRRVSLDARAKLAEIGAYGANLKDAETRLELLTASLTQLSQLSSDIRSDLASRAFAPETPGGAAASLIGEQRFAAAVDALNADINGRFLFAGRAADTRPVMTLDAIRAGDGAAVGLDALIAERLSANGAVGVSASGRLSTTVTADTVEIAPVASSAFGFTLQASDVISTGWAAASGSAPVAIEVSREPAAGETISVTLGDNLGHGDSYTITLRAARPGTGGPGEFETGGGVAATASALRDALAREFAAAAREGLAPRVREQVVGEYFSTTPVRRVDGAADTATDLRPGIAAEQFAWYRGEAGLSSSDARATAPSRIGAGQVVGLGASAEEAGFRRLLAASATMAVTQFADSPLGREAYRQFGARTANNLDAVASESIEIISSEIGATTSAFAIAGEANNAMRAFLEDVLDRLEGVSQEQVVAMMLAAQTRLESSYRTTALLSQLSLVNFL